MGKQVGVLTLTRVGMRVEELILLINRPLTKRKLMQRLQSVKDVGPNVWTRI